MNKFRFLSILAISGLFVSCQDEIADQQFTNMKSENMAVNKKFARLSFDSKESLEQAVLNADNTDNASLTRSASFISLMSQVPGMTRSNEEETYYEKMGYDTLVPNQNFARLINPNGEIVVKDTIYKITPNGTYFFHKTKENEFANIYLTDSIGQSVNGDLYALADGIFRYDTFKGNEKEEEIELSDSDEIENESVSTRAGTPEPNYSTFPVFRAERHTFFGKIREKLLGKDKYYSVKLSKKRKVRGRFYAYNYVAYSEAGVTGMMEKKNFIGWSKTQADELRIEWKNVLFTIKVDDPSIKGIPNLPNELNGAGVHNMRMPDGSIERTIILYNGDVKPTTVQKWFGRGLKEGLKTLNRMYGSSHVPNDYDKIRSAIIASRSTIYIIGRDEKRVQYNTKSMTHVFAKKVHFMITINPMSLPSSIMGWANSLQKTLSQEYPKMNSGEAVICGRLGNDWKGMRITAD